MKLLYGQERFYIICHTDNCGYKSENKYVFPSIEEVEKFLGMRNDYENHIYYEGEDIYGTKHSIKEYEFVDAIYSRTDYEIDWRDDNG